MKIEATQPIGEIVVEVEETISVFENMKIDYSFGGNRSLKDACYLAGVPLNKVVQLLERISENPPSTPGAKDWRRESLESLIDYIVDRHHLYAWSHLAYLRNLSEKAVLEQGIDHPELVQLNWALQETAREIEAHMVQEEEIVFPQLRLLIQAKENGGCLPPQLGGFIPERKPLQVLAWEHNMICQDCAQMHQLTHDFQPPKDATPTVKELYAGFADLEADLHQHTHLENNILFKRCIQEGILD